MLQAQTFLAFCFLPMCWTDIFRRVRKFWESDYQIILDFKLSPCPECCMLSFGWFPGVWVLYADVSKHSVCSI